MKINLDNILTNGWVVEAMGRAGLVSPRMRTAMTSNPFLAHMYARMVQKGRWPEGEPVICQNENIAYQYARLVLGMEMKDAEHWGYEYCKAHQIPIPAGQYGFWSRMDSYQKGER